MRHIHIFNFLATAFTVATQASCGANAEDGSSADSPAAVMEEDQKGITPRHPAPTNSQCVTSNEVRAQLDARQERLNIVATTRTRSGQIVDWIPIESQVPDGVIGTPPHLPPAAPKLKSAALASAEIEPEARGPSGTVPVHRLDPEKMCAPGSARDFFSKYGQDSRGESVEGQSTKGFLGADRFWAGSKRTGAATGFDSTINIWNPSTIEVNSFSLAQGAVLAGASTSLQTVEVGWHVFPNRYGNSIPHFFVYFTTSGYSSEANNVGGYNRDFTGWVQYDDALMPGATISPVSISGGTQYEALTYVILEDEKWWVYFIDRFIGYYPASLFSIAGLRNGAAEVAFQGEVKDANFFLTTNTDMGSGVRPTSSSPTAGTVAYMRDLYYLTDGDFFHTYSATSTVANNTNCYNIFGNYGSTDPIMKSHFWFGGSGRDEPSCP